MEVTTNSNNKNVESSVIQETMNNVMKPSNEEALKKLQQESGDKSKDGSGNEIRGYDLNSGIDFDRMFASYMNTGFQATNLARAVHEINRMLECRQAEMPEDKRDSDTIKTNCTIFLGYTSNMISCGVREYIRYLVQHKLVDCLVCTAGGIEEDFIKCMAPTLSGDFHLSGTQLRGEGINRIGNLLIPNDNYCKFEDWVMPILNKMVDEQNEQGVNWTPSKIINRLGKEINHPDSVYYWAYKNSIPVFSPALTDGSLGDMMYFHSYQKPGLRVDILEDLREINNLAVRSCNTGVVILGGGLIKHHILNANLMRNGADFSVFINTGSEFDGSDAGASPDEAVSWGKIKRDAMPVKVFCDASLAFPIIVAQSFARHLTDKLNNNKK